MDEFDYPNYSPFQAAPPARRRVCLGPLPTLLPARGLVLRSIKCQGPPRRRPRISGSARRPSRPISYSPWPIRQMAPSSIGRLTHRTRGRLESERRPINRRPPRDRRWWKAHGRPRKRREAQESERRRRTSRRR
jgi:hypothetical protein